MQIVEDDGTTRAAEQWELDALATAREAHKAELEAQGVFEQWDEARASTELFAALVAAVELPAEKAVHLRVYHPTWDASASYAAGDRVNHMDALWTCLEAHDAQEGREPGSAPSLWAKVLLSDVEEDASLPEWTQPDSTNPYNQGDRVSHGGRAWVSTCANNVWEPGAHGWEEVAS